MYLYKVGTQSSVLINQVPLFQGGPLREVHCIHTQNDDIHIFMV